MIALIKLIIVLVLSVFSGEPTEEKVSENGHYLELYQNQQKIKIFIKPSQVFVAS
ncbi:hypothetical protein [Gillisia sp. CAL575]|uniref:hypothetical protein n=1 Tax=Gillisia sp. CAL575 TaxID=985255 RepID=UPI00039CE9AC|nr:hypothetical protein [Gillisia sp. CAL575]